MTIYAFGYGSLINMPKNTELKNYLQKKICPVLVQGLKRTLNVHSKTGGNSRVFGVKDVKTANCNGVLFKVAAPEIDALIRREQLYTMKYIAPERIAFPYGPKLKLKPTDQIICFYPIAKYVLPKKSLSAYPVKPAYLNICLEGAAQLGPEFFADFLDLTTGIEN